MRRHTTEVMSTAKLITTMAIPIENMPLLIGERAMNLWFLPTGKNLDHTKNLRSGSAKHDGGPETKLGDTVSHDTRSWR